jgi:hypothetical protein
MPHDESFPDTRQQSRDSYPFPLNNTSAEEVEADSKRRGKSIFQNYEILGRFSKDRKRAYKNDGSRKVENSGSRFFLVHGQTCHQSIDLSMTIGARLRRMPR